MLVDIFPSAQTAEEAARDERYAAQKRAIDREYNDRMDYELVTQTSLYLERHWSFAFFRDANFQLVAIPSGFVAV